MNLFQTECLPFRLSADVPTFHEQWVSGTYMVTGVFPTISPNPTVETITGAIPSYYREIKQNKRALWPRGVCGYYLVPIYCSDGFSEETRDWVAHRPKFRWAIWHEPLLFDTARNEAHCFREWGWYGAAYRRYIFSVLGVGAWCVSRRFGFDQPPRINGNPVAISDPRS